MDIDLLSKMVKELVLDNDEVTLQGVGTFVAEVVPSSFSDKGYTINPPYRKLSFRQRQSDDTLLRDFYIKNNNLDAESADRILSDFLLEMKEVLKEKKVIIFPGLGRLRATRENNFFFVADEDLDIYPAGYGLEPISLKTHQETIDEVDVTLASLKSIIETPASVQSPEPSTEPQPSVISEPVKEPEKEETPVDIAVDESLVEDLNAIPVVETVSQDIVPLEPVPTESEVEEPQAPEAVEIPEEADPVEEPVDADPVEELSAESDEVEPEDETPAEPIEALDAVETPAPEEAAEPSDTPASESEMEPATEPVVPETVPAAVEEASASGPVSVVETPEKPAEVPSPSEKPAEPKKEEVKPAEIQKPKKSAIRIIFTVICALVILAAVLILAFVILAHIAPDFVDSLLYTEEELRIINY